MPKTIRGVKVPKGFQKWAARRLSRRVPFVDGKYQFTNWMIRKHMKKSTLKKWVKEFKRR